MYFSSYYIELILLTEYMIGHRRRATPERTSRNCDEYKNYRVDENSDESITPS